MGYAHQTCCCGFDCHACADQILLLIGTIEWRREYLAGGAIRYRVVDTELVLTRLILGSPPDFVPTCVWTLVPDYSIAMEYRTEPDGEWTPYDAATATIRIEAMADWCCEADNVTLEGAVFWQLSMKFSGESFAVPAISVDTPVTYYSRPQVDACPYGTWLPEGMKIPVFGAPPEDCPCPPPVDPVEHPPTSTVWTLEEAAFSTAADAA